MIVMVEVSSHTIARLWERARSLSKGDPEDREFGAGMQEVLRQIGAIEPMDRGDEYPEPFGNETRGSPP